MASIKLNIVANVVGKVWSLLANFIFVPLYLKFLGIDQYSLISFSLVLHGILVVLDSGLTLTLSREFALNRSIEKKWETFRTLENCYFCVVIVIGLAVIFAADWISNSWLNTTAIQLVDIDACIRIMGCSCALQMLSSFYIGGFSGQERLVEVNIYRILYSIIRAGIVLIPLYYTKNVFWFFLWQLISDIVYCIFLRCRIMPNIILPKVRNFYINKREVVRVGKFAGGVFLISVVAAINTQLDKLVISKIFEISELGVYTLAMTFSLGLISLTTPITSALQPRFTRLISENKNEEVNSLFVKSFFIVSLLVITVASIVVFNRNSILWIWTGELLIASKSAGYIPYLMLGAVAISYQTIPYCIAIGNGNTKFNNLLGIYSLLFTIPGYVLAGMTYGPKGVSCIYAIVQLILTPLYIYLVYKKHLRGFSLLFVGVKTIILPAAFIVALSFILSQIPLFNNRIYDFIRLGAISIVLLSCSAVYYRKLRTKIYR